MREIYGFLRLASRLANPFGHPSQVRTQVFGGFKFSRNNVTKNRIPLVQSRFKTVNFLHYFSKATRGPSLNTTRWEQAGMCGFGDIGGKVWTGRAGKCSWGHGRKVRLGVWQESATAKARDTCIAEYKMASNRLS